MFTDRIPSGDPDRPAWSRRVQAELAEERATAAMLRAQLEERDSWGGFRMMR